MMQRTAVTADEDDLETLRAEAKRRGVSLSTVLGEAVAEKARVLRRSRRPQVAVARSTDGRSAADLANTPVALPPH